MIITTIQLWLVETCVCGAALCGIVLGYQWAKARFS